MRRVFGPRSVVEAVFLVAVPVLALAIGYGRWAIVGASGVAYLVGSAPVLPLPNDAVVAAFGRIATEDGALAAAAEELARVLAPGGRAAFAEPEAAGGEELARSLAAAGFEEVEVTQAADEAVVSGRLS
jgi:SAM-dependent methyltransferase